MSFDYDLFVIGAGPAGHAAAERAASYGVRVAIAEQEAVGGACVNRGCVPMELLDNAASFDRFYTDAAQYGWSVKGHTSPPQHNFNWSHFIATKDREIQHLQEVHTQSLTEAGVKVLPGQAAFLDAHTVTLNEQPLTAERFLIAVGAKPSKPKNIGGIEHSITSREMFYLQTQPQRLLIIGGGYIGTGFGNCLNRLGTQVTMAILDQHILEGWDQSICATFHRVMTEQGVDVCCETTAEEIKPTSEGLEVTLTGAFPKNLTVDTVLCATGRTPNTENLNLEKAGVDLTEKGAIAVNAHRQTSQAHIFAIGDCTSQIELTPVAIAEGRAWSDRLYSKNSHFVNYDFIPAYIAAKPQIAMVGLTEQQAYEKYGKTIRCYYTQFEPLFYSLTRSHQQALMKLVVNQADQERVLGAHMIGDHAADIIQSLGVAIHLGATKSDFDATLGIHPSVAEELFTIRSYADQKQKNH